MNLFNLFVAVLLCMVVVIIAITLFVALSGNSEVGGRVRQRLLARVRELPFYRMLLRRKVDPDRFVDAIPTDTLQKEIRNCEACPSGRKCEEVLAQPVDAKNDYSFCPNDPAISEMEKKIVQG